MTFEHVVTCEVCRRQTGVGFRNNEPVLDPPWHTLTVGSAAWSRHFCGLPCLRKWCEEAQS